MSPRLFTSSVLLLASAALGSFALFTEGCGSDSDPGGGAGPEGGAPEGSVARADGSTPPDEDADVPPGKEGGADAAPFDSGFDAELNGKGETCVGFGKKTPCGNPLPEHGYVCFGGSPPGFAGCVQATKSVLGETYCCPENKCVAQPDQDVACANATGKRRYQCPPDGNGGTVAAPAGCTDGGTGSSAVERFYCCP